MMLVISTSSFGVSDIEAECLILLHRNWIGQYGDCILLAILYVIFVKWLLNSEAILAESVMLVALV